MTRSAASASSTGRGTARLGTASAGDCFCSKSAAKALWLHRAHPDEEEELAPAPATTPKRIHRTTNNHEALPGYPRSPEHGDRAEPPAPKNEAAAPRGRRRDPERRRRGVLRRRGRARRHGRVCGSDARRGSQTSRCLFLVRSVERARSWTSRLNSFSTGRAQAMLFGYHLGVVNAPLAAMQAALGFGDAGAGAAPC